MIFVIRHRGAAGVLHRNISGEAVWLTNNGSEATVKLAGFDHSEVCLREHRMSIRVGDIHYCPLRSFVVPTPSLWTFMPLEQWVIVC